MSEDLVAGLKTLRANDQQRIAELERLNQGLDAQVHDLTQSLSAAERRINELKDALATVLRNNGNEEIRRLEAERAALRERIATLEEDLKSRLHRSAWEDLWWFSCRIRDALKVSYGLPLADLAKRVEDLAAKPPAVKTPCPACRAQTLTVNRHGILFCANENCTDRNTLHFCVSQTKQIDSLLAENADLRARLESAEERLASRGITCETGSAITPRIYLAGQVLAGMIANETETWTPESYYSVPVTMADALLEKLECPT